MYEDILCLLTTYSALWLCDSVIFSISWALVNLEVYVCMYGHTYLYPYIYMHMKLHVYICVSIEWRGENRTVQKYFVQLKQVLLLQNKQTKPLKFCGYKTIIQLKSKRKIPIAKILLHQNERMPKSLGYKCLASSLVIKDISCKLSEVFMQPCHIISLLT